MIVVFLKGKLFQTENYLPFFTALKKYSNKKILIIYPSKYDLLLIKKNKDIFAAIQKVAKIKHFYATYDFIDFKDIENKNIKFYLFGIFTVIFRLFLLKFFLYRPVLLFSTEKIPFISWLININKLFLGGDLISMLIYPYKFSIFKRYHNREKISIPNFIAFKKLLNMDSNILVSSYGKKDLNKLSTTLVKKYNISNVGYNLSSWPSWMKLLEKNVGQEIEKLKKKNYIFYPLSVIKRNQYTKDGIINLDLSDTILFILNAIHSLDKNILVILRPHPTTEPDKLKNILKCAKHKNIETSQINSLFLIKYAKFITHHGVSMLDTKVNIFNKICIRFHDNTLIKALGPELSMSKDTATKNIIDITNKSKFKKTLLKAFTNKINIVEKKIKVPDEAKLIADFVNITKNKQNL